MSFANKTIIVTGATSGIGRATAEAFGRERAIVVLVGRDEQALAEVVKEVSAAAPRRASRKGAVVNVSSVSARRSFPGVLDYCVSRAGVDHPPGGPAIERPRAGVGVTAVTPGSGVTTFHRRSGMGDAQYSA